MNEIEKMYENAGVNKIFKYYECSYGTSSIQVCPIPLGDCIGMCDRKSIWEYPSFTAEKQLELIKWLAGFRLNINNIGGQINISIGDSYVSYYTKNLSDAIALCINSKWQNLTEEERRQIKDILQ